MDAFDFDAFPAEIRDAMRIAQDVGNHADDQAFDTAMRIIDTAPTSLIRAVAMILLAVKFRLSSEAMIAGVKNKHPELAGVADAGIRIVEEVAAETMAKTNGE